MQVPPPAPATFRRTVVKSREGPTLDPRTCIVQLGRNGDILNILPVARHIFQKTGLKPKVMVCREYLPIFERVTYAEPELWSGTVSDCEKAIREAKTKYATVHNTMYFGTSPNQEVCQNYCVAEWRSMGMEHEWGKLPLVFDRRDVRAEEELVRKYAPEWPYVILNLSGFSSACPDPDWIRDVVTTACRGLGVVDITALRVPNFIDLLGLLEWASLLVTTDTSILHLNRAGQTPCIHFGRDGWANSGYVENVVGVFHYSTMQAKRREIQDCIRRQLGTSRSRPKVSARDEMVNILYLPWRGVGDPTVFLKNLEENKPAYPLLTVSDDSSWAPNVQLPTKLRVVPENPCVVWQAVMDVVMSVVERAGTEYFLVLEPDCRVFGDGWDERILDGAKVGARDFVCSGTPVFFNTRFANSEIKNRCRTIRNRYNAMTGSHIFDLTDDWISRGEFAFFPNGALAIFKTEAAVEAWRASVRRDTPWDLTMGLGFWTSLGMKYFDRFSPNTAILSFNGECFTTREYQKQQLVAGRVAAIHNIKDGWLP